MRLLVLGSGTGIPSARRGSAGYLVTVEDTSILFDCGPGTMERLVRHGQDWRSMDRIFLTHHHTDHCADLLAFLFANNWEFERRKKVPLHVVGPRGTRALVGKLYDAFPGLAWQLFEPTVEDWTGHERLDWPAVSCGPVDHADVSALAYRVEHDGRVLVYSGDTGETDRIVSIARGADTLLVDCSFPDGVSGQKSHLTAGGAGRVATAAGAKRVVLTHFYPECEDADIRGECAAEFAGEIVLAEDGTALEI